jgi:sugar phosphate isomerase/epimerase
MKIGIESGAYVGRYGWDKGLEKMREHGFEAIDDQTFANTDNNALFTATETEFEKMLTERRRKYEANGIEVYQVHGPWRYPIRDFTKADREERLEKMERSIRGCAILGCPNMVIHNLMPYGPRDLSREVVVAINEEAMSRLAEVGREYGVVVNMENMPFLHQHLATCADLLAFVKHMDTPWIRMCMDTGHVAVQKQSPADCVRLVGKEYLRTLHVHDNDGKRDMHWNPHKGVIDWTAFGEALREIGFEGVLSLETAAVLTADMSETERENAERELAQIALRLAGR